MSAAPSLARHRGCAGVARGARMGARMGAVRPFVASQRSLAPRTVACRWGSCILMLTMRMHAGAGSTRWWPSLHTLTPSVTNATPPCTCTSAAHGRAASEGADMEDMVEKFMKRQAELESGGAWVLACAHSPSRDAMCMCDAMCCMHAPWLLLRSRVREDA
jgi:hypothetical protein